MRAPRLLLFVSLAVMLASASIFGADPAAASMARAATAFLGSLRADQRPNAPTGTSFRPRCLRGTG